MSIRSTKIMIVHENILKFIVQSSAKEAQLIRAISIIAIKYIEKKLARWSSAGRKTTFPIRSIKLVTGENGADYMGQALITHRTFLQSSWSYHQDRRRRYSFSTSSPNSVTTGLYIVHPICRWAISAEIRCRLVRSRDSSTRLIGLRGTPTLKKGLRSRNLARTIVFSR